MVVGGYDGGSISNSAEIFDLVSFKKLGLGYLWFKKKLWDRGGYTLIAFLTFYKKVFFAKHQILLLT